MRIMIRGLAYCAVVTGLSLAGCAPDVQYPTCETDEHCKANADGESIVEYCVNQQCQQCRDDSHCEQGETCASGRCEESSECPCDTPLLCENKKCVEPECVTDEDCAGDQQCRQNSCVTKQEEAVDTGPTISERCQPTQAEPQAIVALGTVAFDFNEAELTVPTREALDQNAECIREVPTLDVVIEGHCDERGTQEYNLALGERRASAVRTYLINLGVPADKIRTRSKGKNEPLCYDATEACYDRNRRVVFIQEP
jgi:peptidoglycan-associated lipoprotein